ncbi:MAG: BamA/TamA family outer membrane protein, partial [Bacteroidales bacterium]|nr:BamA/TamA family outer membrane protein [Bacteroidales bacterium]
MGVSFQNRNTFGGGEILSLRLRGVYELQATVDRDKNKTFLNTFEAKAEVSLEFPRFLVPGGMNWTSKHFRPSSIISLSYSYQQKRDYSRGIFNATFGYHWRDNYTDQTFNPLEASAVQMLNTSSSFQASLDEYRRTQNYRLLYQYSNHFILTPHYQFVFNNYKSDEVKDFEYFALDMEVAGSLLYGIAYAIHGKKDASSAGYQIFGLPFSQYAKIEADYRHHFVFGKRTELVFRGAVGVGYSYGNAEALPYEKSMFIGGNSTLRAWPLYQLGPGIYTLPEGKTDFERLGDVMLVFNLEQRFPIVSGLRGAVFFDLGNIWIVRP